MNQLQVKTLSLKLVSASFIIVTRFYSVIIIREMLITRIAILGY